MDFYLLFKLADEYSGSTSIKAIVRGALRDRA